MKKITGIKIVATFVTSILLFSCTPTAPAHEHTFSTEWSHDETYHWHESTCWHDVVSDKEEHTYTQTTIEPTYESDGYIKYTCSVCGYFYTEKNADKLEHHYATIWNHNEEKHWHDCTDEGYENLKGDEADHIFGEWIIDSEATESQDGIRHHVCTVCDYSESETYKYKATVKAERVYLSTSATELFTGNSYTINPVVIPENTKHNVKYEIQDNTVASVSNNVAVGLKQGTTLIYAYNDEDNDDVRDSDEAFGVMALSVKDGDPSISLNIDDSDLTMKVGDTKRLSYSVTGATPSGLDYGFYSDNEEVCTVSAGTVKAHKAGKAHISVTWQGYRDTVELTISDLVDEKGLRASGIKLNDESITMNKGETKSIGYSIYPSGSVDNIKSFESNNNSVVTVNNNGQINAVKGGSAIITLTTDNNKTNRILVTVKDETQTYDSCYNNYYGNLTWENSEDLKEKLHIIISQNKKSLKYDTPNWETNQFADQDLFDHASVDAVYTANPILKTETNTSWQREHAFAASLMTGYSTGTAVKSLGRATDFHNLFASQSGANGSRGNKNLGYANPDSAEYSVKEECGYVKKSFEPGDVDKGRLARSIFYMGVMYNINENVDIPESWTFKGDDISTHSVASKTLHINSTELPLQIVEPNVDYSRITLNEFMYPTKTENITIVNYYRSLVDEINPTLKDSDYDLYRQEAYELYLNTAMPYSIGYLSDLLKWNSYSVDYLEIQHNESVYTHNSAQGNGVQGNRNPFVDYPQLVDYIYGDLKDEPGSIDKLIPSYISLEMNKDEIHHYAYNSTEEVKFEVGEAMDVNKFHLKAIKNNLTEGVVDYSKISSDPVTFTESDIATGKDVTLRTDKNVLVIHVSVVPEGGAATSISECTYSYLPTSGIKGQFSGSETTYVATLGSQTFDVTFGNSIPSSSITNISAGGIKIGTGSNSIGTLTMISRTSFVDVSSVFIKASGSSSANYSLTIKVGDVTVYTGSIVGSTATEYGGIITKSSGPVTYYVTGINAAFNLYGLGINY